MKTREKKKKKKKKTETQRKRKKLDPNPAYVKNYNFYHSYLCSKLVEKKLWVHIRVINHPS